MMQSIPTLRASVADQTRGRVVNYNLNERADRIAAYQHLIGGLSLRKFKWMMEWMLNGWPFMVGPSASVSYFNDEGDP